MLLHKDKVMLTLTIKNFVELAKEEDYTPIFIVKGSVFYQVGQAKSHSFEEQNKVNNAINEGYRGFRG